MYTQNCFESPEILSLEPVITNYSNLFKTILPRNVLKYISVTEISSRLGIPHH